MANGDERQRLDDLLDEFTRVADAVSLGRQALGDLDRVVGAVRKQVQVVATEEAYETAEWATPTVGSNLRRLRDAANWTQQQLADAMTELGYSWNQVTVTQIEGGKRRRATFEELFGLAALFSRPVAEFLMPVDHGLNLTDGVQISGRDAVELVLGRGAELGKCGPGWRVARRTCGDVSDRPAAALHRWLQGEV